jgi:hypothetical protein
LSDTPAPMEEYGAKVADKGTLWGQPHHTSPRPLYAKGGFLMRRRRLLSAAPMLVAVLVVVGLALALGACGAGGSKEEAKARPLPEDEKALRPGEYRSEEFKPSASLTVGKGWHNVLLETSDKLAIARGGEEPPLLIFRNLQEVYEYTKTGTTSAVVKAPKDMVGWFQHHPYLDTEKPEPATVGGVKGVQFDYIVSEDAPYDEITLYRYTDGSQGDVGKGFKFRAIILEDVKGEMVTIGLGSPTTEFDDFLPKAQKVLDSVKWTGS